MDFNTELFKLKELKSLLEKRESVLRKINIFENQLSEYEDACADVTYPEQPINNEYNEKTAIDRRLEIERDKRVSKKKNLFIVLYVLYGVALQALVIVGFVVMVLLRDSLDPRIVQIVGGVIGGVSIYVILPLLIIFNVRTIKKAKQIGSYTESDYESLRRAKECDKENRAKNERMARAATEKLCEFYSPSMKKLEADIRVLRSEVRTLSTQIAEGILRMEEDRTIGVVSFLIDKMESGRADSMKEALLLYDEYVKENDRRVVEEHMQYLEAWDRARKEEKEDEYRRIMIDLEQKRLDEARKARKEIEKLSEN